MERNSEENRYFRRFMVALAVALIVSGMLVPLSLKAQEKAELHEEEILGEEVVEPTAAELTETLLSAINNHVEDGELYSGAAYFLSLNPKSALKMFEEIARLEERAAEEGAAKYLEARINVLEKQIVASLERAIFKTKIYQKIFFMSEEAAADIIAHAETIIGLLEEEEGGDEDTEIVE